VINIIAQLRYTCQEPKVSLCAFRNPSQQPPQVARYAILRTAYSLSATISIPSGVVQSNRERQTSKTYFFLMSISELLSYFQNIRLHLTSVQISPQSNIGLQTLTEVHIVATNHSQTTYKSIMRPNSSISGRTG